MATPWKKNVRNSSKLKVFNMAGDWKQVVERSIGSFNSLGLGVKLESVGEEGQADIVVKLSDNVGTHTFDDRYYGTVTVKAVFDASAAHGKTKALIDPDRNVMVKAAVFLPMKLKDASDAVREIVTVHEFIHAAGLSDDKDHDKGSGVFYSPMEFSNGKLKEWGLGDKAVEMPPIKIGTETVCKLNMLWMDGITCH